MAVEVVFKLCLKMFVEFDIEVEGGISKLFQTLLVYREMF